MSISLYFGSRALPLTILYGTILISLTYKKNYLNFFNTKKNFFFLSFIFFITTFLIGFIPQKVNVIDHFQEISQKNLIQNSGDYGVVVAARSEWISIFHATKDKPFIGHGSFSEDKNYFYSYKVAHFLYDTGYIGVVPDLGKLFSAKFKSVFNTPHKQIPSHSFFGYHLVSYGLGGGILLLVLLFYISKFYLTYSNHLNFYYHFNFATFIYNFYFSPWGASHRIELMFFFAALLMKSQQITNNQQN